MSKKDFKGGLDSLLQSSTPEPEITPQVKKLGRPTTSTRIITKSSHEKTREGETRATFIVREDLLEKIKDIAHWERVMIKEVVNTALQDYADKHKGVKPRPNK